MQTTIGSGTRCCTYQSMTYSKFPQPFNFRTSAVVCFGTYDRIVVSAILLTLPCPPWAHAIPHGSNCKPPFLALSVYKGRLWPHSRVVQTLWQLLSALGSLHSLLSSHSIALTLLKHTLSKGVQSKGSKLDQDWPSNSKLRSYGYCHPVPVVQTCPELSLSAPWPVLWRKSVWSWPFPLLSFHHQPLLPPLPLPQFSGLRQLWHLWGKGLVVCGFRLKVSEMSQGSITPILEDCTAPNMPDPTYEGLDNWLMSCIGCVWSRTKLKLCKALGTYRGLVRWWHKGLIKTSQKEQR